MNKSSVISIAAVAVFMIINMFLNFDDSSTSNTGQSTASAALQLNAYGEKGTLNNWPTTNDNVTLAKNAMAKNFYIIVDGSGSMSNEGCSSGQDKLSVAKSSISRFIDKIPAEDNIGMYAFDRSRLAERVVLGSSKHEQVKGAVSNLVSGGSTPLAQAVTTGRDALTKQAQSQLGYGEYNLVIVTDGQANDSVKLRQEVHSLLQQTPIVVHTIGFCISSNHTLNQPGYTIYKAADNPKALDEGLEQVLAEAPSFDVSEFGEE